MIPYLNLMAKNARALERSNTNLIINGQATIAQRSEAALMPTASVQCVSVDRWWSITAPGGLAVLGRAVSANQSSPYDLAAARVTADTAASFVIFGQTIESINCAALRGKSCTLSFTAKKAPGFTAPVVAVQIDTGTGTDQGALNQVIGAWTDLQTTTATIVPTTGYQRFYIPFSVPSGANEVGVRFTFLPVGVAPADDYFFITDIDLRVGEGIKDFVPRQHGSELSLCQRYYHMVVPAADEKFGIGFSYATTAGDVIVWFPETMRVPPTGLEQSGTATDYSVIYAASTAVCNGVPTHVSASKHCATARFPVAAVLTAGHACIGRAVNSSAVLGWSAEL